MDSPQETAIRQLIEIIFEPTEIDPSPVVKYVHEITGTEHDWIELEIEPSFAFSDGMWEKFEELTGVPLSKAPTLGADHGAWGDFEFWAVQICDALGVDRNFTWDGEAAMEKTRSGGIDPVPQGTIALDEWLQPLGFRFVAFDDESDEYHGFAVRSSELKRVLELAQPAELRLRTTDSFVR